MTPAPSTSTAVSRKQRVVLYCSVGFFFAGCLLLLQAVQFALPHAMHLKSLKVLHKSLKEADAIEIRVLTDVKSHPNLPRYSTKIDGDELALAPGPQLTQAQTKELLGILKVHTFNPGGGAMCHDPGYLLRFSRQGHLLLETSLCLHCGNLEMEPFPFIPIWVTLYDPRSDRPSPLPTLTDFFAKLKLPP